MKICIVTHKVIRGDGQGRVNYEISRAALQSGHRVVLVASETASELHSHPSVSWVRIPVDRWPSELLRNEYFSLHSYRWLKRHSHELDVVHVMGRITWAPADINTAHFVHSAWLRSPVHTWRLRRDLYGVYQWFYTALNARLEGRAFCQSRIVVAVSEQIRKELVEIGVPDKRICVIRNGVDLQEFSPGSADRRELGLPERVPLALFVGDIKTPRKNLDTVLHSLVEVPGLHVAVAASTVSSPYPQLAERLRLASRVHFLGYRLDVSRLMRAADLFVFPSRYEAFPLVVLEAMASGLPVITATTAGAAELVGTECGVVVDNPNDTKALAATLNRLVQQPESRKRMGEAARTVAERYSWRQMSERYLRLYEEIVDYKGSNPR
jgi:glycosyltransferase involved in cell wall biosynthesis